MHVRVKIAGAFLAVLGLTLSVSATAPAQAAPAAAVTAPAVMLAPAAKKTPVAKCTRLFYYGASKKAPNKFTLSCHKGSQYSVVSIRLKSGKNFKPDHLYGTSKLAVSSSAAKVRQVSFSPGLYVTVWYGNAQWVQSDTTLCSRAVERKLTRLPSTSQDESCVAL